MLRIVEMADSASAKGYYTNSLARADYYADAQEIVGSWFGFAAKSLGLAGSPIDQQTFAALVDNRHPQSPDTSLTERTRTHRRVGYDINFHAPKGLSLLHALTGDTRIYDAFLAAVRATMQEMEQAMQVRIRTGPAAGSDRLTANWVYGEFVHLTARPTGQAAPDPHLHAHCCVMNASFDGVEGRWKAAQLGSIKRDANYYEAAFHARLARAVVALGYGISSRGKYWDLAAVTEAVIAKFSKRTGQIEAVARERGVVDMKEKDRLGARTRAGKRKGLTDAQLKTAWLSELSGAEQTAVLSAHQRATGPQAARSTASSADIASGCVKYAVAHVYERQSVAGERKLAEAALRHGVDQGVEVSEVWRELERLVGINEIYRREVGDQKQCTTREAYAETSRCIDFTREGMGRFRALAPNWQIQRPELLLSTAADQRTAIEHVLRATDRVIGVRGKAGTGKTYATQEIAAALRAAGVPIQALAPTSKAADVLRQEGFADADTVARMLVDSELQASVAGGVLLIDEAGLLSARQLDRLFRVAREQNCRVLLQYDLGQHRAVERGSPVRDLERYAGLQAAEIRVVRRQKREDYAAAIRDLSRREYESAFQRLVDMDALVEVPAAQERVRRLADEYLRATRKKDATALIVSPTHREGEAVTRAVRSALRATGQLRAEEREFATLRRLGFTEAQRGEPRSYEPGQIIQYTQNAAAQPGKQPQIERGDRLVVVERAADGKVWVERLNTGSSTRPAAFLLALDASKSFEVYESKPLALSIGDRIRITQNGYVPVISPKAGPPLEAAQGQAPAYSQRGRSRSKVPKLRLINNAQYQVARFTKQGDLVLNNGWVLPRGYGHFTHGYCATSYASQGMTADTVLISQSSESLGASSSEQFYVACSRGRTGIKIYTDSVGDLLQAVRRSEQQPSAADLVLPPDEPGSASAPATQRRSFRSRLKEQLAKVISFARNCRARLHTGVKGGSTQILDEGREHLATGVSQGQAIIVEESKTRRRRITEFEGKAVRGPHHNVAKSSAQPAEAPASHAASTPSTATIPRTRFVPMFDSAPSGHSPEPSI